MLDIKEIDEAEKEFFYWAIMSQIFRVFSPFEIDEEFEFPKKSEIGGVILKFIGGGAAYFNIQREMPSDDEVKAIYDVCQFLKESFGEFVMACIVCEPHIEIRDINVLDYEDIRMDFVSARSNDANDAMGILMKKLENKDKFTINEHVLRILIPFMGRKDNDKFCREYSKFLSSYSRNKKELPDLYGLTEDMWKTE